GLTVHAEFDPGAYPTGVVVPDDVMDRLPLTPHDWHGAWNYTLRSEPLRAPEPAPVLDPAFGRFPAGDKTPAWLCHPSLTGLEPSAFSALAQQYAQYVADHPPIYLPGRRTFGAGTRKLSTTDRLLAHLIKKRWAFPQSLLVKLLGVSSATAGDAIREVDRALTQLGYTTPTGPLTITTTEHLAAIAGHDLTTS
ncbi:ISAzo13 family transposase, partial [Streptomyces sp. NPDC005969]